MNIGEKELDKETRQLLCDTIPKSHLIQVFLKDLYDSGLRRQILQLLETNRPKVVAFRSSLGEPLLPDHEALMWKRIKPAIHVPSISLQRTDDSTHPASTKGNPPPLPSKKPCKTKTPAVPSAKTAKKHRSSKPSTSSSFPSPNQRLLNTYFAPTSISLLDPVQTSTVTIELTIEQSSNSSSADSTSTGPPTSSDEALSSRIFIYCTLP